MSRAAGFVVISAQIVTLLICIFSFPFERMCGSWDFENRHLELSVVQFISVSHSWSGNVLVKMLQQCLSFQYVLLTLLSAGNCWDIDLKTKKWFCLFILSLQHYILFIVQIKDCAKSSLLMRCSLRTTWLSYDTVNNMCSLWPWTGLQNNVHNKPNQQNDPESLGVPHAVNCSLLPVCQHILCVVFAGHLISPSCGLSSGLSAHTALFTLFVLMGSRPIIEKSAM